MSSIAINKLKKLVENPPIKWMEMAKIQYEVIEEGHVKFIMPVEGLHLNHVGTVYAGSIYAFAEMCGGALFQATYGFDKWVPIIKASTIKYLKPTQLTLSCELTLTKEEIEEKMKPIVERGRGDYFLTLPICDIEGVQIAVAEMNYYILPMTSDMMKK